MSDLTATIPPKKRPTSLTVMGVIGIVLSGLGLLGAFAGCAAAACLGTVTGRLTELDRADLPPESAVFLDQYRNLFQILVPVLVVYMALLFITNTAGLVGSIGLVSDKRWSKAFCTAYAALQLVMAVSLVALVFIQIEPFMQSYLGMMESIKSLPHADFDYPQYETLMGSMFPMAMKGSSVFQGLLACVFPVLMLVFLNTPKAKAHFAAWRGSVR